MNNNYAPWPFKPTQELYQLFQEKFGKVWESEFMYQFDPLSQEEENGHINLLSNKYVMHYREDRDYVCDDNDIPALTLSAFCELVDEVFANDEIQDESVWRYALISTDDEDWEAEKRLYTPLVCHFLRHFALDNWHTPEKIIEGVKKYL